MEEVVNLIEETLKVFKENDLMAQLDPMLYGEFDKDRGYVVAVSQWMRTGRKIPTIQDVNKIRSIKEIWTHKFNQ